MLIRQTSSLKTKLVIQLKEHSSVSIHYEETIVCMCLCVRPRGGDRRESPQEKVNS